VNICDYCGSMVMWDTALDKELCGYCLKEPKQDDCCKPLILNDLPEYTYSNRIKELRDSCAESGLKHAKAVWYYRLNTITLH